MLLYYNIVIPKKALGRLTYFQYELVSVSENGKPAERQGRKATGLRIPIYDGGVAN